jgi:hypothetical protein
MKHKGFQPQKSSIKSIVPTPDQLTLINNYALEPLTEENVFICKFLIAHTAIDRDNDRFTPEILDDFARTLPGKSLLWGHDWSGPGSGLFFETRTEEISIDVFTTLTGVTPKLPKGITTITILWAFAYIPILESTQAFIDHIKSGVIRHVSIGFNASDWSPIKDDNGNTIYSEISGPGDALEGSFVFLGAQPGATIQKGLDIKENNQHKEAVMLKEFLDTLSKTFGKQFTEDNAIFGIKAFIDEKDAKIKELTPLAEDGKTYRNGLVDEYVQLKAKVGDIAETADSHKSIKEIAGTYPMSFLQAEVKTLQKRVEERFPVNQIKAAQPDESRNGETTNPLIPKEDR